MRQKNLRASTRSCATLSTISCRALLTGKAHTFMHSSPGLPSLPSVLAATMQHAINVIGFNWFGSPALTELETLCMDWLGRALHLPEVFLSGGEGGGFIQASASDAVLVCVFAAREHALWHGFGTGLLEQDDHENSTPWELPSSPRSIPWRCGLLSAYMSDQTHSSVPLNSLVSTPIMFVCCRHEIVWINAERWFTTHWRRTCWKTR